MPATRKVSVAQLEFLVEWMESHPMQARGIPQHLPLGQRLWEEVTSGLNAVGSGTTKSTKEWRQYWSDIKCKIKKKVTSWRQLDNGSGCGQSLGGLLTPFEDRILSLMEGPNVSGDDNILIEVMGNDSLPATAPTLSPESASPVPEHHSTPIVEKQEIEDVGPESDFEAERSSPHEASTPRWALSIENQRIMEERKRRELSERRLVLEEQRLVLEKRRVALAERQLSLAELRVHEEQIWRREVCASLHKIADALAKKVEADYVQDPSILPPPDEFRGDGPLIPKRRLSECSSMSVNSPDIPLKKNKCGISMKEFMQNSIEFQKERENMCHEREKIAHEREKMAHERGMARNKQSGQLLSVCNRMMSILETSMPSVLRTLNDSNTSNMDGG